MATFTPTVDKTIGNKINKYTFQSTPRNVITKSTVESVFSPDQMDKISGLNCNKYLHITFPPNITKQQLVQEIIKQPHCLIQGSTIFVSNTGKISLVENTHGLESICRIFCDPLDGTYNQLNLSNFDFGQFIILKKIRGSMEVTVEVLNEPDLSAHLKWTSNQLGTFQYIFKPSISTELDIESQSCMECYYQHLCIDSPNNIFDEISPEELRFEDQYSDTAGSKCNYSNTFCILCTKYPHSFIDIIGRM